MAELATSLPRAIGAVIKTRLGFNTFADRFANRELIYPCVEVAIAGEEERPAGIGRVAMIRRASGNGSDVRVGLIRAQTTIRLTVKAKNDQDRSSEAACQTMIEALRADFREIIHGADVVAFVDPKTSENLNVSRIVIGESTAPLLDDTGEPWLHLATLTLVFHHRRTHERESSRRINSVRVDHEVRY